MREPPRNPYQDGTLPPTVPPDVAHHGTGTPRRLYAPGGGGFPVPGAGGPGAGVGTIPGAVPVAFPPAIYPPPGAEYYTADASAPGLTSVNTAGGLVLTPAFAGTIGPGLSVQIPPRHLAVVRGVTLIVNNMTLSTDIRWRLLANGGPVPGWDKTISPRIAGSVEVSFLADFTVVRIPGEGPLLELAIEVEDGGTYQAGGTFDGWFWQATEGG